MSKLFDINKIFEKHNQESVFDNMDRIMNLISEAADDEENQEEGGEEEPAPEEGGVDPNAEMGDDMPPADPTMAPQGQEGEPADEGDGIYVSANQKAVLAKTMLDALQAEPPKPGEIPENLLNVTDTNADEVIKYIQSLTSLSNAMSLEDNGDENGLVNSLKEV